MMLKSDHSCLHLDFMSITSHKPAGRVTLHPDQSQICSDHRSGLIRGTVTQDCEPMECDGCEIQDVEATWEAWLHESHQYNFTRRVFLVA